MALQMAYTDTVGNSYTASYWMASKVVLDQLGQTADITIVGFKDAAAKIAGDRPHTELQIHIGPDQFPTYFAPAVLATTSAYVAMYTCLMAQPNAAMFAGATQVP